jgi:arylsulfatase
VFGNGWTMPANVETLAERLRAHGYKTAARIANPAIDKGTGFDQGFDDFALPASVERTGPAMLSGAPMIPEVERLLDGFAGGPPFFVWVHFMDPHGPYFPPQEYRDRFPAGDYHWPEDPPVLPFGGSNFGVGIVPAYQVVQGESSPAVYRARYDAEVRYVDDHVGAVVRALEKRGLSDRTLVVLTADHGESLGAHDTGWRPAWKVRRPAAVAAERLGVPGASDERQPDRPG